MTTAPPPNALSVALANVLAARMDGAARPALLAAAVRPDGPPVLTVGSAVGSVLPFQRRPTVQDRIVPAPDAGSAAPDLDPEPSPEPSAA